jgi:Domain of unknown function (DUF4192)
MGAMSSGAGAQGTKDGPLGVGPIPVLSEPLGSSISTTVAQDRPSAETGRYAIKKGWTDRGASSCPQEIPVCRLICPQTCARPTHSVARPQAHNVRSSRKSVRARRRRPLKTQFKVRRPDELLAVIPYMIGFTPDESVVAVFVRSGRIVLMARMDYSADLASDEVAERIDRLATQHKAHALALVVYSAASLAANRLLTGLMDRLGKHRLTDVLYVGHGRWWSLTCGEECCPLTGTPFDPSSHPMSAAAVFAGLAARANRRELEASVSGPLPAELPRIEALADVLLAELDQLDDPSAPGRLLTSIVEAGPKVVLSMSETACYSGCW